MPVRELIDELSKLDPDLPVLAAVEAISEPGDKITIDVETEAVHSFAAQGWLSRCLNPKPSE